MRTLAFSVITLLFTAACTDQERIEQYEKQLKESNEALEKIIDFRMSRFTVAAYENPEKAGAWAEKARAYFGECHKILEKWPLGNSEADSILGSLEKLQGSDFKNSNCSFPPFNIKDSCFEFFKNQLQIHLNCYLTELSGNVSITDMSWSSYVKPIKIEIGDSTLIILEGVLNEYIPDYAISFEKSYPIKFYKSTSLGHFFLPNELKYSTIKGKLELLYKYSPDVKYYPIEIEPDRN